jgi:hypothetical protein
MLRTKMQQGAISLSYQNASNFFKKFLESFKSLVFDAVTNLLHVF